MKFLQPRSLFDLLIISVPSNAPWWTNILIYLVRLVTLAVLLRTYIAPWILAKTSRHLRVRSISLRSVRGIYLSYGPTIWRIERITYRYSQSKFTLKFEGVALQLSLKPATTHAGSAHPPSTSLHKRIISKAFNPLAGFASRLAGTIWGIFDPVIRPPIRYSALAFLRNVIAILPGFIEAIFLDISDISVTFVDLPGLKLVCASAEAHANVEITQLNLAEPTKGPDEEGRLNLSRFGTVRKSLNDGFRRTWGRVYNDVRGQASLSVAFERLHAKASTGQSQLCNNIQLMCLHLVLDASPFFSLPEAIRLESSLRFIGLQAVEARSVELALHIGASSIDLDEFLGFWKRSQQLLKDTPVVKSRKNLTIDLASPPLSTQESSRLEQASKAAAHGPPPMPGRVASPKSPYWGTLRESLRLSEVSSGDGVPPLSAGPMSPYWGPLSVS